MRMLKVFYKFVKYLKKNKKRTLFTIIGIILSLSLISGVGFLGLSFNDYMYDKAIDNNLNTHILLM